MDHVPGSDHMISFDQLSPTQQVEAGIAYGMVCAVRDCQGKAWMLPARTLTLARIHACKHDRGFADWLDAVMTQMGIEPTLRLAG